MELLVINAMPDPISRCTQKALLHAFVPTPTCSKVTSVSRKSNLTQLQSEVGKQQQPTKGQSSR